MRFPRFDQSFCSSQLEKVDRRGKRTENHTPVWKDRISQGKWKYEAPVAPRTWVLPVRCGAVKGKCIFKTRGKHDSKS
jgi:hypothetical protein